MLTNARVPLNPDASKVLNLSTLKYVNSSTVLFNVSKSQQDKCHNHIFVSTYNFFYMNGMQENELCAREK